MSAQSEAEQTIRELQAAYRGVSIPMPARRRDEHHESYALRCTREIERLLPNKAAVGLSAISDHKIRQALVLEAAARLRPADFRGQPLRPVERTESGRTTTAFVGDCMAAWGDFHRPGRRLAKLRGPSHFERQRREHEEKRVLAAYRRGELKVPNDASDR